MFKKTILAFSLAITLFFSFSPYLALAQSSTTEADQSIKDLLCAPEDNSQGNDLYNCVNKLYKFAIAIGGIGAVAMIVVAGYLYMTGNSEQINTAKSLISTSVVGIVVFLASYVFLRMINPSIVAFRPIQPPLNQNVAALTDPKNFVTDYCKKYPTLCVENAPVGSPSTGGKVKGREPQVGVGQSQDLAKQILANTKIKLGTSHPSGASDSASTAKQNITDTANGQQAATSKYGDAKGDRVQLLDDMLRGLLGLGAKYTIGVTEIAGGDHSNTSRHYRGLGFDISTINGAGVSSSNQNVTAVMALCKSLGATEVLGPGDPDHGTHIHCAW
jgi:hypothetical protein